MFYAIRATYGNLSGTYRVIDFLEELQKSLLWSIREPFENTSRTLRELIGNLSGTYWELIE